ncbi:hypothetical protein N9L68_07535 [bacterium]|nr:hypothetical protein [bacterium]
MTMIDMMIDLQADIVCPEYLVQWSRSNNGIVRQEKVARRAWLQETLRVLPAPCAWRPVPPPMERPGIASHTAPSVAVWPRCRLVYSCPRHCHAG